MPGKTRNRDREKSVLTFEEPSSSKGGDQVADTEIKSKSEVREKVIHSRKELNLPTEVCMVKRILLFMVLFISSVFLVNIPGSCAAESGDNTEINKRDLLERELTADQQGETKEDREITQKIRQAIIKDKSLSTYSDNLKIITVDGMVTLKGPVRSEKEKRTIEEKAARIAGKKKIKSEIEIAP